jgi:basic amino acid/polyamine antiporter, APA family
MKEGSLPATATAVNLMRSMRRWDLVAVVVNGVIGAGIFGLPSKIYALVGSYSILAFCACAVCVLLIVYSFAEVASRFSATGGPYLYASETYGPRIGFIVGWLVWIARVTAFAANCNLLPAYLAMFFPAAAMAVTRTAIVAGSVILLTILNAAGVRETTTTSNYLAIGKLVPLAIFIVVGLFFLAPRNFSFSVLPSYGSFASAVLLLVYAFTGFEMAVIPAGEALSPRKNLPRAIVTGIAIVVTFYILIQLVCIGTLPTLGASQRPLADAAAHFAGYGGSVFITLGILISLAGNLNVLLLSASRMIFAMAERGQLPAKLGAIDPKRRTPLPAILLTGATMLLISLSGTFLYLLTISTLSRLITYLLTCAALPILRSREHAPPAAYSTPGGPVVAYAGVVVCIGLLSSSTFREVRDTGIAVLLGAILSLVRFKPATVKPEEVAC